MGYSLKRAAVVDDVLAMTRALNAHEGIAVDDAALASALARLLADASLGAVWNVMAEGVAIGYAIVTFGYDLEFAGRDAWLTEMWIEPAHRGRGAGATALELVCDAARTLGVRALHLQVRPENPARRVYERGGFTAVPRLSMTRRL
jgi:GNAT superfamily N-acetyltransferase